MTCEQVACKKDKVT